MKNSKYQITKNKLRFGALDLVLAKEAGITLVEALVAMTILSMALIPVLTLSNYTTNAAFYVRDTLTAASLAQEGAEVVRALRDENWFRNRAFDNGLTDGDYRTEWNSTALTTIGSNPFLKINNGLYNYSTGTDSIFKRTISISKLNTSEIRVVSTVTWTGKSGSRSVSVESHLFDWK